MDFMSYKRVMHGLEVMSYERVLHGFGARARAHTHTHIHIVTHKNIYMAYAIKCPENATTPSMVQIQEGAVSI